MWFCHSSSYAMEPLYMQMCLQWTILGASVIKGVLDAL